MSLKGRVENGVTAISLFGILMLVVLFVMGVLRVSSNYGELGFFLGLGFIVFLFGMSFRDKEECKDE